LYVIFALFRIFRIFWEFEFAGLAIMVMGLGNVTLFHDDHINWMNCAPKLFLFELLRNTSQKD